MKTPECISDVDIIFEQAPSVKVYVITNEEDYLFTKDDFRQDVLYRDGPFSNIIWQSLVNGLYEAGYVFTDSAEEFEELKEFVFTAFFDATSERRNK